MKIGIYDPYLDTMSGGERYMLSIAECLSDNHTISLFWDPQEEDAIRSEAKRKFAMELANITFVDNIFTPQTSLVTRLRKTSGFDLIIVLSDGSIPFVSCKMILHFQTPVEWVKVNPLIMRLKSLRIKKVICNSAFTKKFIDQKFHLSSTILYPPLNLPEKVERKKENIIVNVGRFGINTAGSSYKKQEMLVEAFRRMVADGLKDWKLVFIVSGKDDDRESIAAFQQSVKDLPIIVVVNTNLQTVAGYYNKAKIYWHASGFGEDIMRHPDRAEHFGISTVEAMLYGAVPIVINAGGQPEIITSGENGFLWDTEEQLIQYTKSVMENEALRKRLSGNAEERAAFFDIARFCKELYQIIT